MAGQVSPSPVAKSDRMPPYSEEAERGVLGSALLDAARVVDFAVEHGLSPESFYAPAHQTLFEILLAMTHYGAPIDLLTVGEQLKKLDRLDDVGGATFLERLVDSTPTSAHAEYYIDIVRQKHLLRMVIDKSRQAIDECYSSEKDADSVLNVAEQAFFDIKQLKRGSITPWPDLVKDAMTDIENIFLMKKGITGLPTGYADLDKTLMGLQPSDMIVLAARPSMGKTSLALNIAENIALGTAGGESYPVAVFSLEMSKEQLVRRMICSHARVPSHKPAGRVYFQGISWPVDGGRGCLDEGPDFSGRHRRPRGPRAALARASHQAEARYPVDCCGLFTTLKLSPICQRRSPARNGGDIRRLEGDGQGAKNPRSRAEPTQSRPGAEERRRQASSLGFKGFRGH